MNYTKPNWLCYRITQIAAWLASVIVFRRKILRNEIRNKKGPFVVVANHQAMLDFVNVIGLTRRRMTFVISNSFYNSLPFSGFMKKLGVIPKQQFQTAVKDLKKMKKVIDNGEPLVIYPAGLMCEDGLSTPIPTATYKFLVWLGADVYAARTAGTYFAMPKWAKGLRPGRTYMDTYRLFTKEELKTLDMEEIRRRTEEALLFDAYREQEKHLVKYKNNRTIEGLENVLYRCPNCGKEFSIRVREKDTIFCEECGFEQVSDEYGFLHNQKGMGEEIRYVSDWSRMIYDSLKEQVVRGEEIFLEEAVTIKMIDYKRHKFKEVGGGALAISREGLCLKGNIGEEFIDLTLDVTNFPTLPFSPGKHLELQHGSNIYRCLFKNGKMVMKYINLIKIFSELNEVG